MPRRLVIHPGFHKTGTSTVQRALRTNRALLKPFLRSVMKGGLQDVCHASRGYSTWGDPITLHKFRRRFRAALAGITPMPRRCLLISAEELAGHLPGRDGLDDFSAAVVLAQVMSEVAAAARPEAELVFCYSTRAPDKWLRSAYWQHVRGTAMTMDFEEYRQNFEASSRLDEIVDAVDAAVDARVERFALEDCADLPAGPATPLLDLCDVPREVQERMKVTNMNVGLGDDVLQALLQANRRHYADREAREAEKQAILDAVRDEGND